MTTQRIFRAAAVTAALLVSMFVTASPALAQIGGVGDVTGTAGGAAGGATDTVNETVGGATDTVNETVGGATDTVNETAGTAGGTVNETVGGVADTVNETVGGGSGTGGEEGTTTGSGPSGSKGTTSPENSPFGTGSNSGGAGGNHDEIRVVDGVPVPEGATVIRLPDGSTVVIPGNAGGSIDGRKVLGGGSLPKEVLVALNGLTDGFASAGATTPLESNGTAASDGPTFLENASRLAAEAAKKMAFPTALLLIVLGFLVVHGKIGRRDPKLAQARIDSNEDALTFR